MEADRPAPAGRERAVDRFDDEAIALGRDGDGGREGIALLAVVELVLVGDGEVELSGTGLGAVADLDREGDGRDVADAEAPEGVLVALRRDRVVARREANGGVIDGDRAVVRDDDGDVAVGADAQVAIDVADVEVLLGLWAERRDEAVGLAGDAVGVGERDVQRDGVVPDRRGVGDGRAVRERLRLARLPRRDRRARALAGRTERQRVGSRGRFGETFVATSLPVFFTVTL
ncbi:hypothetical protein [Halarchaeum acidiphilum]|uniref:hypothetical protein n=1 Tax=Halarchaeum acidiphilum TaxID=489138 RepID=UPI000368D4B3|nr:hypothetical protein [Halarchaeum acidiphilum]